MIQTHAGISYDKTRRFGTDCHVHIIDLTKSKMTILNGFRTVPEAVTQTNASIGFNAGGWGLWTNKSLPNEWLIIEGKIISMQSFDGRPCMHISKTNVIEFLNRPNLSNSWNVIGFDRYIAQGGVYNARINDNSSNPRTVYGKTTTGKLVVLVCEGRLPDQKGLTFAEVWSVMKEYQVTDCGNADGGYSSAAVNTSQSPSLLNKSYLGEVPNRRVVYQVLFTSTPTGVIVEPPPVVNDVVKLLYADVTCEMTDGTTKVFRASDWVEVK